MFVHITSFRVSTGQVPRLRERIAAGYLPIARKQPGFERDYFLEKVDDAERAQLVLVWESQSALENFRNSDVMDAINKMLHANLPGLRMQSDSYIVRLRPGENEAAQSSR